MAGYLQFKKEAPKKLVLRSSRTVATTAIVKDTVEEEPSAIEVVNNTALEELEDVETLILDKKKE